MTYRLDVNSRRNLMRNSAATPDVFNVFSPGVFSPSFRGNTMWRGGGEPQKTTTKNKPPAPAENYGLTRCSSYIISGGSRDRGGEGLEKVSCVVAGSAKSLVFSTGYAECGKIASTSTLDLSDKCIRVNTLVIVVQPFRYAAVIC